MFTWRNFITASGLVLLWAVCLFTALLLLEMYNPLAVIFPLFAAFLGTALVVYERVEIVPRRRTQPETPTHEAEKTKRGAATETDAKMRLLLELMDDDEREAFKYALQQQILGEGARLRDDGELYADAETLGYEARPRRNRR